MKKYFTTIETKDNQLIATLFDASNNQELYKTKPYISQSKALQDVNNFITKNKPVESQPSTQSFTNTTIYKPVLGAPAPSRRCCGR